MKVNLVIVFNKNKDKVLMCQMRKDPYKGKLNFVGGKVQKGESSECAAYRELFEETGISSKDIVLHHLVDSIYFIHGLTLEVYFGYLEKDFEVYGDENPLLWIDVNSNFFDIDKFAGKGNLGHFMEMMKDLEVK